jgi:hypothetical protein
MLTDGQTWIVIWTVVHEALACCRVSLFIESARNRKAIGHIGIQLLRIGSSELIGTDVKGRSLGTGRNIRASGRRYTMLGTPARGGIGMEGLDVKQNGNNVLKKVSIFTEGFCVLDHLKPKSGA